ncbi:unnamed protein product [Aureobasidium uvarum]|uniref:Uncharacterized protein n=1 Tax=Aureobasidium uvarum TaxID=2773716 RepID=A0A9N8KJE5_9PEZI|nr:unnamed protein product [Aureobasidium uvarum]
MAPINIKSHASSKTPSAYIPSMERLDLTMPKSVLQKAHTFSFAHLNYLQCHEESVFADENCINLFMNALRLHWKVSGDILRNASDQGADLYELLSLEVDGKYIIRNLLTTDAVHELFERDAPDPMMILATIVQDIYIAQWRGWSVEQNQKHKEQSRSALIISHAQATSNQLSNNVLAFKGKNTAPQLRAWAERTVARHLMAIITPGHLPPSTTHSTSRLSTSHDSVPDLKSANQIAVAAPRLPNYKRASNDSTRNSYTAAPGPNDEHYEVPFRPIPSTKRKAPVLGSYFHASPSTKRAKIKTQGTATYRAHDLYRPSRPKRATFHNGHGRLDHGYSREPPTTPSPIKRRQQQALDTPSHEALRKAKLHKLQKKIAEQRSEQTSCIGFTDLLGSDTNSGNPQEHETRVFNEPSYAAYRCHQKCDSDALVIDDMAIVSEEGEILE